MALREPTGKIVISLNAPPAYVPNPNVTPASSATSKFFDVTIPAPAEDVVIGLEIEDVVRAGAFALLTLAKAGHDNIYLKGRSSAWFPVTFKVIQAAGRIVATCGLLAKSTKTAFTYDATELVRSQAAVSLVTFAAVNYSNHPLATLGKFFGNSLQASLVRANMLEVDVFDPRLFRLESRPDRTSPAELLFGLAPHPTRVQLARQQLLRDIAGVGAASIDPDKPGAYPARMTQAGVPDKLVCRRVLNILWAAWLDYLREDGGDRLLSRGMFDAQAAAACPLPMS